MQDHKTYKDLPTTLCIDVNQICPSSPTHCVKEYKNSPISMVSIGTVVGLEDFFSYFFDPFCLMYCLQPYKFPLFATKVILIKANLKTEPHVTAYMQRLHLIELVWVS